MVALADNDGLVTRHKEMTMTKGARGKRGSWASGLLGGALCLALLGCGGSLKYRIDNAVLADVPVADKGTMLAVESEINAAREEQTKAASDRAGLDRDISVARSDYGQAKLEVDKAEADLKLAKTQQDLNQQQAVQERIKLAKQAREVADLKVDLLKLRRAAIDAQADAAKAHTTAAEARYELEKARLAQARGKRPTADFNVAQFEQQATNAQGQQDKARVAVEQAQLKVAQREQAFNQADAALQSARGRAPAGTPGSGPPPVDYGQPGAPPPSGAAPPPGSYGQPGGAPPPGTQQ